MRIHLIVLALTLLAAAPAPKPAVKTAPKPAAATSAVPIAPSGWQTVRDPAGVFSAEFPEAPATQKQTAGQVATTVYAVNNGSWALMVIVSDMSALALDAKQATESAMASIAQGKTPLSNKPIKLGKHAGRVVTAADANTLYTDQMYFFNHRLYQAISARPKTATSEETARADHFHKAFRLK
jgi:hypothetical protein